MLIVSVQKFEIIFNIFSVQKFEIIINIFLSDINNFSESSYQRGSLIEGCGRDHGRDNCPLPEKFT